MAHSRPEADSEVQAASLTPELAFAHSGFLSTPPPLGCPAHGGPRAPATLTRAQDVSSLERCLPLPGAKQGHSRKGTRMGQPRQSGLRNKTLNFKGKKSVVLTFKLPLHGFQAQPRTQAGGGSGNGSFSMSLRATQRKADSLLSPE